MRASVYMSERARGVYMRASVRRVWKRARGEWRAVAVLLWRIGSTWLHSWRCDCAVAAMRLQRAACTLTHLCVCVCVCMCVCLCVWVCPWHIPYTRLRTPHHRVSGRSNNNGSGGRYQAPHHKHSHVGVYHTHPRRETLMAHCVRWCHVVCMRRCSRVWRAGANVHAAVLRFLPVRVPKCAVRIGWHLLNNLRVQSGVIMGDDC